MIIKNKYKKEHNHYAYVWCRFYSIIPRKCCCGCGKIAFLHKMYRKIIDFGLGEKTYFLIKNHEAPKRKVDGLY